MTVGEMEARMSNVELTEWWAYHARKAQRAELDRLMSKHKGR